MLHESNKKDPRGVLLDGLAYDVLGIKEGGMGRVWLLQRREGQHPDPVYRPRLAAKTFRAEVDSAAVERELDIWISLRHRSIVPLVKIGRLNYRLAALMPMFAESLESRVEAVSALDVATVVSLLKQMLNALDYAWTKHGVLHLDIKPSNILVSHGPEFEVSIADWGISRLAGDRKAAAFNSALPSAGSAHTAYSAGTPLFMAPERFSGVWALNPAADLFSVGMTGVYLLTGILPFRFDDRDPLEELYSGSYLENAKLLLEPFPKELTRTLLNWLAPSADDRPSAFGDARQQLPR